MTESLEYVVNPRLWVDLDCYCAEIAFGKNRGSTVCIERIERITSDLYVARRKIV